MPDYVINEPKSPAFKPRELLTGYGRPHLGLKRYPGPHCGSLPSFSNDGWALAMLEKAFRLERKAEREDLSDLITTPPPAPKPTTKRNKPSCARRPRNRFPVSRR